MSATSTNEPNGKERRRKQRTEMLNAMSLEERRTFIDHEQREKVESLERLKYVMHQNENITTIAIDLRYDGIMNSKEINSLAKQLKFVYGSIKAMPSPFQLRLFHCSPDLRTSLERFDAGRWIVQWHNDDLKDVHDPSSIVYLSPDSPNILTTIDRNTMYVIGGIVDKSRKKGTTLRTAQSQGIQTARLPIQEYITQRLDHILNINTVVDVLIHFREHGDWEQALTSALPQRKQQTAGRKARRRLQRAKRQTQEHKLSDDTVETLEETKATTTS